MDWYEGDREAPLSLHKYIYALTDPVNRIDRSGRDSIAEFIVAAAVFTTIQAISAPSTAVELVQVRQIQYQATANGVAIRLGALTRNRIPSYPEYRWVQFITTNNPLGGAPADTPYNDPQPSDDDKPFYYTDAEEPQFRNQLGYDYIFVDAPRRNVDDVLQFGSINWHADLSLTGVSPAGSVNYTPFVHISYGFKIDATGVTLEPLAIGR